jgi:hypothetical protein
MEGNITCLETICFNACMSKWNCVENVLVWFCNLGRKMLTSWRVNYNTELLLILHLPLFQLDSGQFWKRQHLFSLCHIVIIVGIIKSSMRWVVHVASMGERRNVCKILIWKCKAKRPVSWEIRHRWKGDVKCILDKHYDRKLKDKLS